MPQLRVVCPACGITLVLNAESGEGVIRCGHCGRRFLLEGFIQPTEDQIAGWLNKGRMDSVDLVSAEPLEEVAEPVEALPEKPQIAEGEPIRLVKIGHSGALFEFPASRLQEIAFRCALPRRCLRCSTQKHLCAHVVIFTSQLADSVSIEDEHEAGALELSEHEVQNLTCEQMLDRLPKVPNVPPPGNLPMPYWICDMCSGAGTISGQIKVNRETGTGWCRLRIHNLRRAEEFLVATGAKDTPGHRLLLERLAATAENPWDTLPEVVQHRLEQWFRPLSDERFMAYIPDRDRSRTEDGMTGLLVSNRRIIYHSQLRHREVRVTQPLELQLATGKGRGHLQVKTPKWVLRRITVDRDGLAMLRRALSLGKFRAIWH